MYEKIVYYAFGVCGFGGLFFGLLTYFRAVAERNYLRAILGGFTHHAVALKQATCGLDTKVAGGDVTVEALRLGLGVLCRMADGLSTAAFEVYESISMLKKEHKKLEKKTEHV